MHASTLTHAHDNIKQAYTIFIHKHAHYIIIKKLFALIKENLNKAHMR